MKLKPWYDVVKPRADLRTGQSLDTSEFAVHLDMVHHQQGDAIYWQPEQFFARTYLTKHLLDLSAEVVRRLSGNKVATSPIFNMTTQFGGGKTHALTLLYHLAQNGPASHQWLGVQQILEKAGVAAIPQAKTAIFVGQRFDPRGGDDGTPWRRTPWAEIAWQLAGAEGVALMSYFDEQGIAPGGDTIGKLFTLVNQPILILMDELLNYVSRYRQNGLGGQLYNFLQNLSEEARAHNNIVVAVSIPASEYEMTVEDQDDYRRLAKMLDRLGKAVMMSAETDTAEIIRRRLFDLDEWKLDSQGRIMLTNDAVNVCKEYAAWAVENRRQLPSWFPVDNALDAFKATYPFHPVVLSVFERKWQSLPNFQRTRGVLRLLALWVMQVYQAGYRQAHKDALIELGTAPFEDGNFRAALFKQLNEDRLETAIMTDIAGGRQAHAVRLDNEANTTIKQARLHRKVAATIFFESNGGQTKDAATLPEIRLAVGNPNLDISNVETVLEALAPPDGACYYLDMVRNLYRFDWKPNLLQILSDRKASVSPDQIDQLVRSEVERQFGHVNGVDVVTFPPERPIRNQPMLTIAVLPPEYNLKERATTLNLMERLTQEHGASARTFKSAIIWAVADEEAPLREAARKRLAWEAIDEERDELQLNDTQKEQLRRNLSRAAEGLRDAVWQAYRQVYLLGKDNSLRPVDFGRHNASSATSLTLLILRELRRLDDVVETISANFLVRNWPPAFTAWSVKTIRDAFYASPQFPRLINAETLKETIARGVANGQLAYVGKAGEKYHPFYFRQPLTATDVEITEDMFVITPETAEAYLRAQAEIERIAAAVPAPTAPEPGLQIREPHATADYGPTTSPTAATPAVTPLPSVGGGEEEGRGSAAAVRQIRWSGEIPAQKWGNFYMSVLAKFANRAEWRVRLRLGVEISSSEPIAGYKVEEMKTALRDLGLSDQVETDS